MPNILLIVVDQLRYDCLGFARDYPVRTPNLDHFAEEATWFTAAYTPIPLCCPARQAMLSGKRPETTGGLWNYDLGPPVPALNPDTWTWSRALSDAGYDLSYVGKWHVNPDHDPTAFGFHRYTGIEHQEARLAELHPDLSYRNGWFGEDDPAPLADVATHWLADRAIADMRRAATGDAPWLVRLDLSEPHLLCRPAKPFSEWFAPGDVPPWRSFGDDLHAKPYIQRQQLVTWRLEDYSWDDWAPIVARYYNVIGQVDDAVGRVLAALDALPDSEDTVVIFTSDHGDMCGAHGMIDKHYVMYDDVVRVPLIVRLPGQDHGQVSDEFVYNALDLAPTLLDLAGVAAPEGLQGRSLLPVLRGEPMANPRDAVVSTYNGQQFGLFSQRMLREREWKYIWNATDVDELYDLRADPDELENLAGDPKHAVRLAEMRKALHAALVAQGDRTVDNPWLADQLLSSRKITPAAPKAAPVAEDERI